MAASYWLNGVLIREIMHAVLAQITANSGEARRKRERENNARGAGDIKWRSRLDNKHFIAFNSQSEPPLRVRAFARVKL